MACVAEFMLTATLDAFSRGRESFLIYLEVLDDASCGRHFHFIRGWRTGDKERERRLAKRAAAGTLTRLGIVCMCVCLCGMFLEAFIGARVRCTHGKAPQQPCHCFLVARMRRRTSGVAGDVPLRAIPPPLFHTSAFFSCGHRSHWPPSVTREPPVLLSAALQSREEGLRVR
ncbi:hypothetical protein TcG_12200 [Trypanosoma cruzi]|nr:hypothetical protein TcG_12200 [Trypanosoma cruzi]